MPNAGGIAQTDVIKWNFAVVDGHSIQLAFAAFQKVWGSRPKPPLISVAMVAGLADPDFLVECKAVAVVAI
ncbi:MAG: hypothetical protein ACRD0W_01545 [Acidimicrobiales bacterium]